MLNEAGRTTLVRSTLSAIPVHLSIVLCLSSWAVEAIDRRRRAFLWSGSDSVAAGRCRVAWSVVCRPRDLGGLGITDLRRLGIAFRVRWLWLRRTASSCWVNLPERTESMVDAVFRAATDWTIGDGESILFWLDNWIGGSRIKDLAPALFAALRHAGRRKTVAQALRQRGWVRDITGALTVQVLLDYIFVWELTEGVILDPESQDRIRWRWSADGVYSASSAYNAMFFGSTRPLGARQLWKTKAPPKVKHFFWLAMHGRCWTAERRYRHGLQDSDSCALCDQCSESLDHLLLGCVYSRELWSAVLGKLNLHHLIQDQQDCIFVWWLQARKSVPKVARAGFDSLFLLIGWSIWKERNARTFGGQSCSPMGLLASILDEAREWNVAGYRSLSALLLLL